MCPLRYYPMLRRTTEPPVLAIDATGVGPAVVDLFRAAFEHEGSFQVLSVIGLDGPPPPAKRFT
jgi:hypothetical protein